MIMHGIADTASVILVVRLKLHSALYDLLVQRVTDVVDDGNHYGLVHLVR